MRRLARLSPGIVAASLLASVALAVEGDVVLARKDGDRAIAPAVFPHWIHRIRYKCYACHPAPFEMKAGANPVSMEAIRAGKFCGACHDGKIAWEVTFDTCNRCHAGK